VFGNVVGWDMVKIAPMYLLTGLPKPDKVW
jgi:hypothetical protein